MKIPCYDAPLLFHRPYVPTLVNGPNYTLGVMRLVYGQSRRNSYAEIQLTGIEPLTLVTLMLFMHNAHTLFLANV